MFLALTSDQQFWKPGETTLLLGRWCQPGVQTRSQSPAISDVLPYHWDDSHKLHNDHAYLTNVYERYIVALTQRLNAIHKLTASSRFWRIVAGSWLAYFIDTLFDRYECIRLADQSGRVHLTWLAEVAPEECPPSSYLDAVDNFTSDPYTLILFSQIIDRYKPFPYEVRPCDMGNQLRTSRACGGALSRGRAFLGHLGRPLAGGFLGPAVFLRSGMGNIKRIKLQLALGQVPYIAPGFGPVPRPSVDIDRRKRLELSTGTNAFERLLDKLIATNIPTSYVEAFEALRSEAMQALPSKARTIVTSMVPGDDRDTIWIADQAERGTKVIVAQHGGGFGSMALCRIEEIQRAVSDHFFSWGWKEPNDAKLVPMPANPMLRTAGRLKCRPSGRILLPANIQPRYAFAIQSAPLGPQFSHYFDFIGTLCSSLSENVRPLTMLRPHFEDFGWHHLEHWRRACPGIDIEPVGVPFLRSANQSRLIVATHNGTVLLEGLAANFPTIICWDKRFYELRTDAQPYFALLRDAGIFFEDPKAAARQIELVAADILGWWSQPHVQRARLEFCQQYVQTHQNWIAAWRNTIRDITRARQPQ